MMSSGVNCRKQN
jgi:hypothetical protein